MHQQMKIIPILLRKITCSAITMAAINVKPTFKAHLDDINPELFHLQLGISLT